MNARLFGRLPEGDVHEVTIGAGTLEAKIITWGAVLRDLRVPDRSGRVRPVVLGLDTIEAYAEHSPSFGAVVGRYANRIGGASFPDLDGKPVRLIANENGNTLHGGPTGFGRRIWRIVAHDERSVHLALLSPDGEEGWPGRLLALAAYTVEPPSTLRIELTAFADRPTPVNLTVHSYFNLDGSADARDHELEVPAEFALETDEAFLPAGAILPVADTPLDFRRVRPIRPAAPFELDTPFVLGGFPLPASGLRRAASLRSPLSGIDLQLFTTEPSLQVYDGWKIDLPVPGLDGVAPYGACAGIALEPQRYPDGPNHRHFVSGWLRPGELSRQTSEYRFAAVVE